MQSRNLPMFRLWNTLVRMLVSAIGLLIARVVILRLPMLEDVPVSALPLPLGELLALAAVTAIFVIILLFGRQLIGITAAISGPAAVVGQLVSYGLGLLVVVLAYGAYKALARELLGGEDWVYALIFIILGLVPVIGIALAVYRNLDMLTASIVRGVSKSGQTRPSSRTCPKCGQAVPGNVAFCASCGASLAQQVATQHGAGTGSTCGSCGTALESGAKFCPMCGQAQRETPPA